MAKTQHRSGNSDDSGLVRNEDGAIGYIAAWILGIPASVLFLIFLMRGCN